MASICITVGQYNPAKKWDESHQLPKGEDPVLWAEEMVRNFNRTLKKGEQPPAPTDRPSIRQGRKVREDA